MTEIVALYARADRCLEARDYHGAIRATELILESYPADFRAHFNLGAMHFQLQHYDDAARYYRSALNVHPDHPFALFGLASSLYMHGDMHDAIRLYRECLKHECPEVYRAHLELALAYQSIGRARKALPHLLRYRKLVPPGSAEFDSIEDLKVSAAIINILQDDPLQLVWSNHDPEQPYKFKAQRDHGWSVIRGGAA